MAAERASNVTWHAGRVTREDRASASSTGGATIWVTGLSGSGKSTLAVAVEHRLIAAGRCAYRLDGDNLRTGLNADLGFSRDDRHENVRRAGEVACLFADAGLVAVVALISPYAASRDRARELHQKAGIPFVEVYMSTPVETCATRDPKGLYAQAASGGLSSFTGVDDPYEVPAAPELKVEPGTPLHDAVEGVLGALARVEQAAKPAGG